MKFVVWKDTLELLLFKSGAYVPSMEVCYDAVTVW